MKFWDNIDDLPVYYYAKIIESGDLRYLQMGKSEKEPIATSLFSRMVADIINVFRRKKISEIERKEIKTLMDAWANIEEQIIEINIDSSGYRQRLFDRARLLKMEMKAAISGSAIDKLNYEIAKNEEAKKAVAKSSIHDAIAVVERHLRIQINEKNMSVRRFYLHLKFITNGGQN